MCEDTEGSLDYLSTPNEGDQISVIEQVSETLLKIADFGSDRPIDYFEPFSYILKEERQTEENPLLNLHQQGCPDFVAISKAKSRIQTQLFPKERLTAEVEEEEEINEQLEGETPENHEEEEEEPNEGEVPNVISDMKFLHEVGLGLTTHETILLQLSIQKLIRSHPISTARFWGKVNGVERDYYIVEVEFHEGSRPHPETNEEEDTNNNPDTIPIEEETGPNTYNYFVCNTLGGKWTLLPDIEPIQISSSRCIKQMFTGDLNAEVNSPPNRFKGTEKELLRSFIARVYHSCTISPKGQYISEEEPEEDLPLYSNAPIVLNEEHEFKALKGMEDFVHRTAFLLPQGRVDYYHPINEEEEKNENEEEMLNDIEVGPPILRSIVEDEPINGNIPSWSIRVNNDKIFWLRSNTWPGLNVVSNYNGERVINVYFGWGMKATEAEEWPPLIEKENKEEERKRTEKENENGNNEENENGKMKRK
ncbi:radial spoke head protein 4 A [Histomonas meleagridis]|nr:radial spoke head protein 4 A [Histomonas meleagridis]